MGSHPCGGFQDDAPSNVFNGAGTAQGSMTSPGSVSGTLRSTRPVAIASALASAGATRHAIVSLAPLGPCVDATVWHSTLGIVCMRVMA